MNVKTLLTSSFAEAWQLIWDFPMPGILRNAAGKEKANPYFTMLAVPVTGLAAALLLLIFFKFCTWIFSGIAPAMLFAVAATLFLDCKDSGRGLSLTVTAASLLTGGTDITPALPKLRPADLNEFKGAVPAAVMVLLELFKLWGFFILARYGAAVWIIAVLVLSFTVQGVMMTLRDLNGTEPFLAVMPPRHLHIWIAATVLILFLGLSLPKAALAGLVCSFIFAVICRNWFERIFGGATAEMVTLAGSVSELMVLLLGLLLYM